MQVYEIFVANLHQDFDAHIKKHFDNPITFFTSAFLWEKSPQGHFFWSAINEEWRKKCLNPK